MVKPTPSTCYWNGKYFPNYEALLKHRNELADAPFDINAFKHDLCLIWNKACYNQNNGMTNAQMYKFLGISYGPHAV